MERIRSEILPEISITGRTAEISLKSKKGLSIVEHRGVELGILPGFLHMVFGSPYQMVRDSLSSEKIYSSIREKNWIVIVNGSHGYIKQC